jgi:uncharacterized cupin superfamily protein
VVPEAPLERTDAGLVPAGEGWFVVNARAARWFENEDFGAPTVVEGDEAAAFPQLGINIGVLHPGEPACMYHGEDEQEDFLVLSGECLLLIEGEERELRAWDFVHCPRWTEHVFVGAGDGPCVIVSVGTRTGGGIVYPVSELARRRRAGVEQEARDGKTAYAQSARHVETPYREGWLPDS